MSDIIDTANDHAMRNLDIAVAVARTSGAYLQDTGRCYNCNEPVSESVHFCDVNCRNDWQARNPNA